MVDRGQPRLRRQQPGRHQPALPLRAAAARAEPVARADSAQHEASGGHECPRAVGLHPPGQHDRVGPLEALGDVPPEAGPSLGLRHHVHSFFYLINIYGK